MICLKSCFMDLYLFPEDFKGVFDEIRSQFQMAPEYDGGTLFAYKYGTLRNGEMEFGLGSEDTALFYHHHPLDAEDYNSISVRSLYEELVLLRKNKITESDIIYEDWRQGRVINIGKMVEK